MFGSKSLQRDYDYLTMALIHRSVVCVHYRMKKEKKKKRAKINNIN